MSSVAVSSGSCSGAHGSEERKLRALQQLDCVARTVHQCAVYLKEQGLSRRWDSERELLRSTPERYPNSRK